MCFAIRFLWGMILLSLLPFSSAAQNSSDRIIDSLQQEIRLAEDSLKVYLYLEQCVEICYQNDPARAVQYAEKAHQLATQIGDNTGIGRATFYLGHCKHLQDDFKAAKTYFLQAAEILATEHAERFLCDAYSSLGQILTIFGEYQASLDYFEKALAISKKLNYLTYATTIISGMANNYSSLGDFTKAFQVLEEGKPLIQHRPHLINYYGILGDVYRSVGKVKESLNAFNQAAALCAEFNDQFRMAFIYRAIADLYAEIGNYEMSLDYFLQTIKINEAFKATSLETACYLGLGKLYKLWEDYDQSIVYYQKALDLATDHDIDEQRLHANLGLAQTLSQQDAHAAALVNLNAALELALKIKSVKDIIHCQLQISDLHSAENDFTQGLAVLNEASKYLPKEENAFTHYNFSILARQGAIYLKQGQFRTSLARLSKGLKYIRGDKDKAELSTFYKNLSQVHQALNNHQSALLFHQQYSAIQDSLQTELNSKKLASLRTSYEISEKEKEIQLLQNEKEIQKLSIANQEEVLARSRFFVFGLGLVLLLVIGFFWTIFNRYKWKKKTEQLELVNSRMLLEKTHLATKQQLDLAQLRSRLFTNISHEFRTPLTLILSPLETMVKSNQKANSGTVQMIYRNAQKLLELVNQSLDLAKLESGNRQLNKKKINLEVLLNEIVKSFQPLAEKKKIQLAIDWQTPRRAAALDQPTIEKAISNLLSNALRHSGEGAEITLTMEDQAGENLLLKVKDQGTGIPAEHHSLIFNRYYQVDNERLSGTGIGLALCKEIVELHDGKITVESEVGAGAIFTISIPWGTNMVDDPEASPASIAAVSETTFTTSFSKKERPTILVVEDHTEVREYIAEVLRPVAEVMQAADGLEGLHKAKELNPDLIVSDIMMPEMEGLQFTEQIKREFNTSHIPVVLLTAKASMESKLSGLRTGADDYLTKPFNPEELQIRCHNLIQQRRKLRAHFAANQEIVSKDIAVNKSDEIFLDNALALVRQRLPDPDFNVERFAQEIGISRTNLYNKLKSMTGKNVVGFIRTLRIQHALTLIQSNSGNMNEIAFAVGFSNRQSFIKSFKVEMGSTPSEYKRKVEGQLAEQKE